MPLHVSSLNTFIGRSDERELAIKNQSNKFGFFNVRKRGIPFKLSD